MKSSYKLPIPKKLDSSNTMLLILAQYRVLVKPHYPEAYIYKHKSDTIFTTV